MRTFFALILLLSVVRAQADWVVYPLNAPARFERGASQEVQPVAGLAFAVGLRFQELVNIFEIQTRESKSSSGFIDIERRQLELSVWRQSERPIERDVALFWNLGFGLVRQDLLTRIDGVEEKSRGEVQPLTGVGLGMVVTMKKALRLSLEGRAFFSPEFDPNPQPEILGRLGFSF